MKLSRPTIFQRIKPPLSNVSISIDAGRLMQLMEVAVTTEYSIESEADDGANSVIEESVLHRLTEASEESIDDEPSYTTSRPAATVSEINFGNRCKDENLPAAYAAMSNLPWTRILPSDRKMFQHDETECRICCERLIDGFTVTRLPCGHLYHHSCCMNWLGRNNSCPECRYELPTQSKRHEAGRVKRMKERPVVQCDCQHSQGHECFFVDSARGLGEQLCSEIVP